MIIVVYVFPVAPQFFDNAARFIASYNQHPPGIEHRLIVVSNGGAPTLEMRALLDQADHPVEIFEHSNAGYDIGAFQAVARHSPADMAVFFGSSAYVRGPHWLKRMAVAFERRGKDALYGCTANCGDARVNVFPHIRTTGFWMAPLMLNMYPLKVTTPEQRYPAEHGPACITEWFRNNGHRAFMVTWEQEVEWPHWDGIPNGFHRGDQSALLCGDRLTCPPYYATA